MPLLSDQELRAIVDRIRYLETELKEAKTLVAVLESNLMAAKEPDLNAGNEGVTGLGGDRLRGFVTANLKTGESDITMTENENGRFMKLTAGPILIPASEFAENVSQDIDTLWAANISGGSKASTTDDKSTE